MIGGNLLPLTAVVTYGDGRFDLDRATVLRLVDAATTGDPRYSPSTVRREARKIETRSMHEGWQREYRRLRASHPDRSGVWYARKIASSPAGGGKSVDTIRKHMTG